MHTKGKILLYSSNLWNFGEGMFGPLLAVYTQRIGGSILDVSWAWAIYLIVTGVCVIFVGQYSDRHSKEKIMITGYFITAICSYSYLLVHTPAHLFILQAVSGLGLALCNPTWYALYHQYTDVEKAGSGWGLADGQAKIVSGIAIIIGGFVVNMFSFEALFVVIGSIQLVSTLYQITILRPDHK